MERKTDIKTLIVGDILYNPLFGDLWLVTMKSGEIKIMLVHTDYVEDIEVAETFQKIGNVYEFGKLYFAKESTFK